MTRSSNSELFTTYEEPEREFRSSRRHFKSLSLDELRSPNFNLFSDQEYSKEEEAEAMAETMEQYMSKTRTDYGSGVARPNIEEKDSFELKGQFLKELLENTFSGSDNEDANKHIEKVLEIVDLFHVPNITEDQLMLRVFPISLSGAAIRWLRNEPTEPDETLYQAWERFKELLMKCPQHYLTEMQEVILFYNGLDVSKRPILGSQEVRSPKTVAILKKGLHEWQNTLKNCTMETSRGRRASVSVMPLLTYLNLGLGELAHTKLTVELADRTVKYPKGIAKMIVRNWANGETLDVNRSLDPLNEDYIELNDLNEPFKLRRNQGDDLMPTLKEGELFEEFRTRDEDLDSGVNDYPSYCDDDKKIHKDCANL
ncbi:hypothetical protein Tco_0538157 [Tanacetum coccineum]